MAYVSIHWKRGIILIYSYRENRRTFRDILFVTRRTRIYEHACLTLEAYRNSLFIRSI